MTTTAPIDDQDVVQFDIRLFRNVLRVINFTIYVRWYDEKYSIAFSETTGIDTIRLNHFIRIGVTELFVAKADEQKCLDHVNNNLEKVIQDPSARDEIRVGAMVNFTEQNFLNVFGDGDFNPEIVSETKRLVSNYIYLFGEDPSLLSLTLKLISNGDFLYYHSVATSIFSIILGTYANVKNLESIALGGYLHDIGHAKINPRLQLLDPKKMKPAETKEYVSHVEKGLELIDKRGFEHEVKRIVVQHHEQPDGKGFPHALGDSYIQAGSKIVKIADDLSKFISPRPYQKPLAMKQAIETMYRMDGHYDFELLSILEEYFLRRENQSEAA